MANPTLGRAFADSWAVCALLLNALVWGLSWWPFRQLENSGLHPLWATAFIYSFATLCVLVWKPLAVTTLLHTPALWALALASGLTNIGFNWAVTVGDVVRVVLLFYLMPAWVVLLAWPLLGEKPSLSALARLGLAFAGVIVILKQPGVAWPVPNHFSDYLALMGGVAFAITNILLRKLNDSPDSARMLGMFAGGAIFAGAVAVWGSQAGWVSTLPTISPTLLWIALPLALAFLGGNLALQFGAARLRANTTSLVMLSEIVFASVSASLLGAAQLELNVLWGGGLIFSAALWAAYADNPQTV